MDAKSGDTSAADDDAASVQGHELVDVDASVPAQVRIDDGPS
jgi:hypothetical protein